MKSLGVWADGKHIGFRKGEYETNDKKEIEVLKTISGVTEKAAVPETQKVK